MTSHSRRSIAKDKTSHVFTGLRRRAFQAQACITTWSWTCCSTALIIVSPLTDRNRSEVWLLPECKQFCSLKNLSVFFISLPPPPPPQPTSSSFVTLCNSVTPLVVSTANTLKHGPVLRALLFFTAQNPTLIIWWWFQWEDQKRKTINKTIMVNIPTPRGFTLTFYPLNWHLKCSQGSAAWACIHTKMYSRRGGAQALRVSHCSVSWLHPADSTYILLAPVAAGLRCSAWALNWNNRLLSPRPC